VGKIVPWLWKSSDLEGLSYKMRSYGGDAGTSVGIQSRAQPV